MNEFVTGEAEVGSSASAAELLDDLRRYPELSMTEYRSKVRRELRDAYGARPRNDLAPGVPGVRRSLADVLNRPAFQSTAFLVNALLSAPDFGEVPAELGIRVLVNWRGREHRIRFSDLVIVPRLVAGRSILSMPVQTWDGSPKNFSDAVDEVGGIVERSNFLLNLWRLQYQISDEFLFVHAPVIHATRPMRSAGLPIANPDRPSVVDVSAPMSVSAVVSQPLEALSVISLPWGGAADVAALIAERWGWSFTAVSRLEGQVFDRGIRFGHGDYYPAGPVDVEHQRHRDHLTELTERLLDPSVTGRQRVSALDFPISTRDALARIQTLWSLQAKGRRRHKAPLVMIRVSGERIAWVSHRHSKHWHGPGTQLSEFQAAEIAAHARHLQELQEELTRQVQDMPDRPHLVVDLPDPHGNQYRDENGEITVGDPVDDDFEAFHATAELVAAQLEGVAAGAK